MAVDVFLSPSNQRSNQGYDGYGTEAQRMNMVADVVEYELKRHGLTVARNNPNLDVKASVAESNAANPKVHVAIHSNAADGNARGSTVFVHKYGLRSERLAKDVYQYLSALSPTKDLGVQQGAPAFGGKGYYELRRTKAPAILIETMFHDNPEDADFIINHVYEIGVAIAKGILKYFNIPYKQDTAENIASLKNKYNGKYF
jgi:N-acetylmuramoyl-L-alanine amidase